MSRFLRVQSTLFLCLSALCWGPSYLFIKIAIPTIDMFTLAFLRVAIAAVILYGVCYILKNRTFEWRHYIKHYLILGFLLNVLPQCLIIFGETYVSSALAGILNSFTVIFTAILSHFFGTHDLLNKNRVLGILSGALAKKANVGRESLYKTLSGTGNPKWHTLVSLVIALGLNLRLT